MIEGVGEFGAVMGKRRSRQGLLLWDPNVYRDDLRLTLPGKPFRNIDWSWCKVRERAELKDVGIQDLRHLFASRALALGESLPVIGKLLGHT